MAAKKKSSSSKSNNKVVSKKTVNKAKKAAKSNPKIAIAVIIIVLILGGIFVGLYFSGALDKWIKKADGGATTTTTTVATSQNPTSHSHNSHEAEDGIVEDIIYDDFQIHFLELGNEYAGDSVYIKAAGNDILIDAGSRGNSAKTLTDYVDKYCKDGKLEYVISTHNHQDHIAGFAGVNDTKATNYKGEKVGKTGVFYHYEVGTLIDFTYASVTVNKKSVEVLNKNQKSSDYGSSTEYGKYLAAREYLIEKGTTYYTAKDLWDNNKTVFNLSDDIKMTILYNYYYFNESNDVNNYSVCSLFTYKDHNYMLTGDLEKEGEEKLAEYYDSSTKEKTLPHCDLFKAGHHGSKTSSNDVLLNKITPSICVACCCAGSTEYTVNNDNIFPTQDFINRIAKHTSRVYVTSLYDRASKKNVSFNGIVIVSSNGDKIGLSATNNLTRLKDTTWFNEKIYVVSGKVASGSAGSTDFYTESSSGATLVPQRVWPE